MKLENKIAIVAGADKGIVAAITVTLAREGADLMLAARNTAACGGLYELPTAD